ncbi:MAG: anti-anti-sigma factor, partial [Acidimicrobiaceae bacterium]|nr:anti-anti-sigma factor [Acidimicrobiaceae bacterium]
MSVTIQRSERLPWTVLSVGGELDVVGAPDLRQAVV